MSELGGIPSWAVRGAKIVCLVDDWDESVIQNPGRLAITWPVKGPIYTVREVRVRYVSEYGQVMVGILLDEISNPIAGGGSATGEEMSFDAANFRPLVSNAAEDDIAIFAPLLDAQPELERA